MIGFICCTGNWAFSFEELLTIKLSSSLETSLGKGLKTSKRWSANVFDRSKSVLAQFPSFVLMADENDVWRYIDLVAFHSE